MVLITGGMCSGKSKYALRLSGRADSLADSEGNAYFGANIHDNLEKTIRSYMQEGILEEDILCRIKAMIDADPCGIYVISQVGSGVIPADKFEIAWRENCGRAGCLMAEHSERVYRMVCGVAQRLK